MTAMTIPGTDEDLRAALDDVNLPTLLMVMTQLCGDDRWLTERYRPAPIETPEGSLFPDDSGGYSDEIATEIRTGAFELLKNIREHGGELPPPPDLERMRQMMEFSTAEPVEDEFCAMLLEETNFVDRDEVWRKMLDKALGGGPVEDFNVIVVGAGMSGICTGVKLEDAGIPYTILRSESSVASLI